MEKQATGLQQRHNCIERQTQWPFNQCAAFKNESWPYPTSYTHKKTEMDYRTECETKDNKASKGKKSRLSSWAWSRELFLK